MSRVLDASVAVDLVIGRPELAVLLTSQDLHVPAHFDVECISAVRGLLIRGRLDLASANVARERLDRLQVIRYPLPPLMERAWQLRDQMAIQDAAYVALAEAINAPLVTVDERLARSAAEWVEVEPRPSDP